MFTDRSGAMLVFDVLCVVSVPGPQHHDGVAVKSQAAAHRTSAVRREQNTPRETSDRVTRCVLTGYADSPEFDRQTSVRQLLRQSWCQSVTRRARIHYTSAAHFKLPAASLPVAPKRTAHCQSQGKFRETSCDQLEKIRPQSDRIPRNSSSDARAVPEFCAAALRRPPRSRAEIQQPDFAPRTADGAALPAAPL